MPKPVRSRSPTGDPRELIINVNVKVAANQVSQQVRPQSRPHSRGTPVNDLPRQHNPLSLPSDAVFGGESNHRRGHRDCTPPPLNRRGANDVRPHTSPSPAMGASLLPLQQKKSRWIGHPDSTQQFLPLTKSLLHPSDDTGVQRVLAGGAPAASAVAARVSGAETDPNPKLPKLNDSSVQGATRPLGRAKTTGKLLSHSNT